MGLYNDGRFDATAARLLPLEKIRHDYIRLNFNRRKASAQGGIEFGTLREDQKFPPREIPATRALTPGFGRNVPRINAHEEHLNSVSSGKGNRVGCESITSKVRPYSEKTIKNEANHALGLTTKQKVHLNSFSSGKGNRIGCESITSKVRPYSEKTIKNEANHALGLTTKQKVPPKGKVVYLDPAQIIARQKDQNFEALKRFRNLLNEEENRLKELEYSTKRIDILAYNRLKRMMWYPREAIVGSIPGVEVGDEFTYRLELKVVGLHRPHRWGIDYLQKSGNVIATSIVASGGYDNNMDDADFLDYCGHGGMPMKGDKRPKDQKLERGNLALKNSIHARNVVRVIVGLKEMKDSDSINPARGMLRPFYVYSGLYFVQSYRQETGCSGASVFKFRLRRLPGQPNLDLEKISKKRKLH